MLNIKGRYNIILVIIIIDHIKTSPMPAMERHLLGLHRYTSLSMIPDTTPQTYPILVNHIW